MESWASTPRTRSTAPNGAAAADRGPRPGDDGRAARGHGRRPALRGRPRRPGPRRARRPRLAPPGHSSWESYCQAEFGISRAQAYRLLDVARSLTAIHGAVIAGTDLSRTRDSDPGAAAALDYGLPQRALIAVSGRTDTVAKLISGRLAALAHSGLQALDTATVRAVVRQAVRDVRTAPPPPPADPPADPTLAALRAVVDDLVAINHEIGELMLEVAPAYFSDTDTDTDAADVLALLCDQIGEPFEHGLAAPPLRHVRGPPRPARHRAVTAAPMSHPPRFSCGRSAL